MSEGTSASARMQEVQRPVDPLTRERSHPLIPERAELLPIAARLTRLLGEPRLRSAGPAKSLKVNVDRAARAHRDDLDGIGGRPIDDTVPSDPRAT